MWAADEVLIYTYYQERQEFKIKKARGKLKERVVKVSRDYCQKA